MVLGLWIRGLRGWRGFKGGSVEIGFPAGQLMRLMRLALGLRVIGHPLGLMPLARTGRRPVATYPPDPRHPCNPRLEIT